MEIVYFIRHHKIDAVKIGRTKNLSERMRKFNTYSPFGCELLGTIETSQSEKLEQHLHQKYRTQRVNGEWFLISEQDVNNELNAYNDYNVKSSFIRSFMNNWIDFDIWKSKQYISDFCNQFKAGIEADYDNRKIMNALRSICSERGYVIEKGRDHHGRFFSIFES